MSGSDTTTWHDGKRMKKAGRTPILAAGGIVVRGGPQPLIAIVQLRKQNDWVLPKGKLTSNESALAAAKREVLEETGHDVSVHEFLGTMSYDRRQPTKNRAVLANAGYRRADPQADARRHGGALVAAR